MSSRTELEKQLKEHDKLDRWWATLEVGEKKSLMELHKVTDLTTIPAQAPAPKRIMPDPFPMEGSPSGHWPVKEIGDEKTT